MLRHTHAKSLLDPAVYGLDPPPAPLTVVQRLLGHADLATTARYTQHIPADLARFTGEATDKSDG